MTQCNVNVSVIIGYLWNFHMCRNVVVGYSGVFGKIGKGLDSSVGVRI
jgi:hypothetical protein